MKVLVVGGSQFNGFALVQELVRRDTTSPSSTAAAPTRRSPSASAG